MIKSLNVFLKGSHIGSISLLPGGAMFFSFDEEYRQDSNRPTLSQSFLSTTGELMPQSRPSSRLHPFFSNLLPEGPLRDYLVAKNNINPARDIALLQALGEDLPGAITVSPSAGEAHSHAEPDTLSSGKSLYRFSLAGVQLKFSALLKPHGGLTLPASGIGGKWIVKLPSASFLHVPENEYAMMTLANQVGIETPDCHLVSLEDIEGLPSLGPFQGHLALAVKRFDRGPDATRIHMEDFAQVYGLYPEQKYEKVSYINIANMVWILCGEKGLTEYIRRLVFSILIGNGDMHLKNWSFLYPDGRTPVLSPAYDLLSTVPYIPKDKLALTLAKTREMRRCTESLFASLAEKAKLPKHLVLETAKETTEATREKWAQMKQDVRLDQQIIATIDQHMKSVPL